MNDLHQNDTADRNSASGSTSSQGRWTKRDTVVAIIAAVLTTVVDQLHNIASLFN